MNRIFRVIWNYSLNCFVAVGELSRRRNSSKSSNSLSILESPLYLTLLHKNNRILVFLTSFAVNFYVQSADLSVSITPPPTNELQTVGLVGSLITPVNEIIITLNATNTTVQDLTVATNTIVNAINTTNNEIANLQTVVNAIDASLNESFSTLGKNALVDASALNAIAIGTSC